MRTASIKIDGVQNVSIDKDTETIDGIVEEKIWHRHFKNRPSRKENGKNDLLKKQNRIWVMPSKKCLKVIFHFSAIIGSIRNVVGKY